MALPKSFKKAVFGLIILLAAVVIVLGVIEWHAPRAKSMTLEEALWVCTSDMKIYYPPGSTESLQVVRQLSAKSDFNTNTFRTACYLCYRIGVLENSSTVGEPLVWCFDPAKLLPAAARSRPH